MSLLFQVLRSAYCRGTHHKLALDALTLLRGPKAVRWQSVFLRHHADYLEGAKDPDTVFRDFENHVLHVRQGYWGGACERARYWYDATVRALQAQRWEVAAYNGGVLSHYVTDPMMPLHTAQSPAETNIHRAVEWSISQTYDPIWEVMIESTGLPQIEAGTNESWLEELVTAGAEIANRYYEPLIANYDFAAGSKVPQKGLPAVARHMIGQMLAFATVSLARILERACIEAGETTEPPLALPSLDWFFATLEIPIEQVLKRLENQQKAALVRAQFREFQATGAVNERLTEDVRVIRDLCGNNSVPADPLPFSPVPVARAVAEPVAAGAAAPSVLQARAKFARRDEIISTRTEVAEAPRRGKFDLDTPVEKAPSIGPKTAARLAMTGIVTVGDFLAADPAEVAARLRISYMSEAALREWQDQCRLMLDLPRLRGRDAQILVGAGYRSAESILGLQPEQLLVELEPFLHSERGAWVMRDGKRPGLREATQWVASAEERASRDEPELVA